MGYKVFFKNINLNYSVGKVRWRPWAERGGRIATNTTTFNREILIVEKANDGKPFELHTSYDDKEKYYRNLRNPWLFLLLMFALFAVTKQSIIFGIFALVSVIPGSIYQIQVMKSGKDAQDAGMVRIVIYNRDSDFLTVFIICFSLQYCLIFASADFLCRKPVVRTTFSSSPISTSLHIHQSFL